MWKSIEKAIQETTSRAFSIESTSTVSNGDINQSYCISGSNQQYFVKINDKKNIEQFNCEAYSLSKIRQSEQISCPSVITKGTTGDKSFLVLDYINFKQPDSLDWYNLGQQIAYLLLCTISTKNNQFGWTHDNFIGYSIQKNTWQESWSTFFTEQRIAWQLQKLHEKSIHLGNIDHIVDVCAKVLSDHKVVPCIVHGDLWQGNLGVSEHQPVIFDPACYFGDREVDIAMTELFGRIPEDFYLGYQEIYPLNNSYEQRKQVYNFYHILNHANLFAGQYIEQSKAQLQRILSLGHL